MSDDNKRNTEIEELETSEWLYSLDWVLEHGGPERVVELLHQLQIVILGRRTPFSGL